MCDISVCVQKPAILENKRELFDYSDYIIRYLSMIQRFEKQPTENFLLLVRSDACCILGHRGTMRRKDFRIGKRAPHLRPVGPQNRFCLEHVTHVSPFRDIQSRTIFKYSLNLIKTTQSRCRSYVSGENAK